MSNYTYTRCTRIVCDVRWMRAELGRFLRRLDIDGEVSGPLVVVLEPEDDGYVRVLVLSEAVERQRGFWLRLLRRVRRYA